MHAELRQLRPTLCDPMDCSLHGSLLCPRDYPSKSIGVGCHFLLQGIFLTQESNPHLLQLLHWLADSLPLSHLGSPRTAFLRYNSQLFWDTIHPFKVCDSVAFSVFTELCKHHLNQFMAWVKGNPYPRSSKLPCQPPVHFLSL